MAFVRAPPDRRPRLAFHSVAPARAGCLNLLIAGLSLLHHQAVASANYSRASGASRRNVSPGSRVPRAALPFSFIGQSPSESLITGALLGGAVAALFFIAFRRSFRGRTANGSPSPVTKEEAKVFRPCASICLNEVKNDEEEHEVMDLLERMKAFEHGLQSYRVMFSSTREGRASMVRQLQPLTHIDADGFLAITLEGKVPNVVCLREPLKECVDVLQAALHSPGT